MDDTHEIRIQTNGKSYGHEVTARRLLGDVPRDRLGLTGPAFGCEHGVCGT